MQKFSLIYDSDAGFQLDPIEKACDSCEHGRMTLSARNGSAEGHNANDDFGSTEING